MTSRRNSELGGGFSDNWGGRRRSRTSGFVDVIGAIAFMQDTQIAQVQLAALGYNPGVADGKLGPNTADAIRKFQTKEALLVNGTLDTPTKRRLYERTATMGLKLPGGTPIASAQPTGTNTPSPSDVLLTPTLDLPTMTALPGGTWPTMPTMPGMPTAPTIPSVPGGAPGVPQQGPSVQPEPPPAAPEVKILGMSRGVALGVFMLAGSAAAVGGYAWWKKSQDASRPTVVTGFAR